MGLPIALLFFPENEGLIVLPLVYYHFFQLVVGTLLIPVWKRGTPRTAAGCRAES